MTDRSIHFLRCGRCGRGVHCEEAIFIRHLDENVCPRCADEITDQPMETTLDDDRD